MSDDIFDGFDDPGDGESRKKEGLDRVEKNSGAWVHRMRAEASRLALGPPHRVITIDDLREHAAATKDPPHHPNAWGSVFRGPTWKWIGFQKSRIPSNHVRAVRVWRYII